MAATAAARALIDVEGMDAEAVGRKAMDVAADLCVYTNKNFVSELLDATPPEQPAASAESEGAPADSPTSASS